MAFDAKREDYLRLCLRFTRELGSGEATRMADELAGFGRRFANDRDSLPQTDADRAFHLVAEATDLIDYQLPFTPDDAQAQALMQRARNLLDEALSLDPQCHDAARMRQSGLSASVTDRLEWLLSHEGEVRESCERQVGVIDDAIEGERGVMARNLAMRPLWRWMASEAADALVCGRNRQCLDICRRLLESDPDDNAGARLTATYALAKLEDEEGIDRLRGAWPRLSPHRGPEDPWSRLADVSSAYKARRMQEAEMLLDALLRDVPHAAAVLTRQADLPDGEFSRVILVPDSEDELTIATSEAIVLLQEGAEPTGRGALGAWVAAHVARRAPQEAAAAAAEQKGDDAR